MNEYQRDYEAYQRDYEATEEPRKYEDTLVSRAMNHVENIFDKVLLDLKREIEDRFNRLEGLINDVKFTRKSTIWIIVISAVSLVVMIVQIFLSR